MKILFIGESWTIHMIHSKGFDSFTSTKYEEGANYLLDVLKEGGIEVDYMPSHEVQVRFPNDVSSLLKYDAVILSDIGSNTFLLPNSSFYNGVPTANSLSLLKEFVAKGGGLLMIGGYLSFSGIEGKANYSNSPLSEVLPVVMEQGDDRVETPEGIRPKNTNSSHFITEDIERWPEFLGYNRFKVKEDAETLVEVEGDPFLVVGNYKKGKTACFASDCSPHWGTSEFMEWEKYGDLFINVIKFLNQN